MIEPFKRIHDIRCELLALSDSYVDSGRWYLEWVSDDAQWAKFQELANLSRSVGLEVSLCAWGNYNRKDRP